MKAMKLPKEIQSFLDVAETAEAETLVFTKKKRPVDDTRHRSKLCYRSTGRVRPIGYQSIAQARSCDGF